MMPGEATVKAASIEIDEMIDRTISLEGSKNDKILICEGLLPEASGLVPASLGPLLGILVISIDS